MVEEDEQHYRVSQPNSRCNSGRGQSQVGLVFRTGCDYSFCAVTGRKPDDPFSWYTRQYTQEKTARETEAYLFIRIRTEDAGIGVHRQDSGSAEMNPPFTAVE